MLYELIGLAALAGFNFILHRNAKIELMKRLDAAVASSQFAHSNASEARASADQAVAMLAPALAQLPKTRAKKSKSKSKETTSA